MYFFGGAKRLEPFSSNKRKRCPWLPKETFFQRLLTITGILYQIAIMNYNRLHKLKKLAMVILSQEYASF